MIEPQRPWKPCSSPVRDMFLQELVFFLEDGVMVGLEKVEEEVVTVVEEELTRKGAAPPSQTRVVRCVSYPLAAAPPSQTRVVGCASYPLSLW